MGRNVALTTILKLALRVLNGELAQQETEGRVQGLHDTVALRGRTCTLSRYNKKAWAQSKQKPSLEKPTLISSSTLWKSSLNFAYPKTTQATQSVYQ